MLRIAAALPAAWRRLPPPERYLALQLLARLLPPLGAPAGEAGGAEGEDAEAARKLLDALAQAAPGQRAQTTDTLKVTRFVLVVRPNLVMSCGSAYVPTSWPSNRGFDEGL